MLDLDLLQTFVAVTDAGSFTQAARRVHRTQSTVSQQIRKLEEDLGRKLLHRSHNAEVVALTSEGEVLLGYARRMLEMSAEARNAILDPGAPAVLRLGIPEDFAGRTLMDLLSGFALRHPHLRLDTTSAWSVDLRRLLAAGDLDLSLVKRAAGEGHCLARWPERLSWVAGRQANIRQDPVPLALFPQGCIYRRRALDALDASGRPWRVAYVGQGLAGVQAAVAANLGIGLLATSSVLPDHRILGAEDGFPEVPASELALVGSRRRLSGALGELVTYLEEHLGALPA